MGTLCRLLPERIIAKICRSIQAFKWKEAIEEFTFKNRDRHFRDETLGRMVGLARSETFK